MKRHTSICILIALLFFIPVSAGADVLSAEAQRDFSAIPADPEPESVAGGNHFVITNEDEHFLYQPVIKDVGGVYLGVGSNQNYDLSAWARSEIVILMDFDQVIVDLHEIYRVAFLTSETPEEFVALWSRKNEALLRERIEEWVSHPEKEKRALKVLRYARKHVHAGLKATIRRDQKTGIPSYLTDQDQYSYLVTLFREARVYMIRGDLTGEGTMKGIAKVLRKHGHVLRVVYLSNAEQYFSFGQSYRENISGLPTDERSLLLRTRPWKEFLPGTRIPEGDEHYTYMTQSFKNMRAWMNRPQVRTLYDMIHHDRTRGRAVHFDEWPKR